jgi:hypothetical protein
LLLPTSLADFVEMLMLRFSNLLVLAITEIQPLAFITEIGGKQLVMLSCTILCTDKIYLYQDDILPKLMAGVGSHDDLFKKEISKYDPISAEIADNIVAQEQLLLQLQVSEHP